LGDGVEVEGAGFLLTMKGRGKEERVSTKSSGREGKGRWM
jgi:hypothetical protein